MTRRKQGFREKAKKDPVCSLISEGFYDLESDSAQRIKRLFKRKKR